MKEYLYENFRILAQPAKESASEKTDITAAVFFKAAKTFSDLNLCDITVASFFE
jgi:hypothetical protein